MENRRLGLRREGGCLWVKGEKEGGTGRERMRTIDEGERIGGRKKSDNMGEEGKRVDGGEGDDQEREINRGR